MSGMIHMFDCGFMNKFEVSTEKVAREICMRAAWTTDDWPSDKFNISYGKTCLGRICVYVQTNSGEFLYDVTEEQCYKYMKTIANEFFGLCEKVKKLIEEIDQRG